MGSQLTDAYEEVEEQRQVVGQWKRKVQKLNGETNDLRLLLEEQNARNNLLEKKQRKFDSETQLLQDELKKEKQARERLAREKEVILAEKYSIESTLAVSIFLVFAPHQSFCNQKLLGYSLGVGIERGEAPLAPARVR